MNRPSSPRVWERDPMGTSLEQKLVQVQQAYGRKTSVFWKVLGVIFLLSLAVAVGGALRGAGSKSESPKVPMQIYGGYMYRLTGITMGKEPIAVINNRVVKVGDPLNSRAVVSAIRDGEVILDIKGVMIRLTL